MTVAKVSNDHEMHDKKSTEKFLSSVSGNLTSKVNDACLPTKRHYETESEIMSSSDSDRNHDISRVANKLKKTSPKISQKFFRKNLLNQSLNCSILQDWSSISQITMVSSNALKSPECKLKTCNKLFRNLPLSETSILNNSCKTFSESDMCSNQQLHRSLSFTPISSLKNAVGENVMLDDHINKDKYFSQNEHLQDNPVIESVNIMPTRIEDNPLKKVNSKKQNGYSNDKILINPMMTTRVSTSSFTDDYGLNQNSERNIKPKYILYDWYIRPLHKVCSICVEGLRSDCWESRFWHSSAIAVRINCHLLQSCSNTIYKLVGEINKSAMKYFGFSDYMIHLFQTGFPENWTELWEKYLAEINSSENDQKQFSLFQKILEPNSLVINSFSDSIDASFNKNRKTKSHLSSVSGQKIKMPQNSDAKCILGKQEKCDSVKTKKIQSVVNDYSMNNDSLKDYIHGHEPNYLDTKECENDWKHALENKNADVEIISHKIPNPSKMMTKKAKHIEKYIEEDEKGHKYVTKISKLIKSHDGDFKHQRYSTITQEILSETDIDNNILNSLVKKEKTNFKAKTKDFLRNETEDLKCDCKFEDEKLSHNKNIHNIENNPFLSKERIFHNVSNSSLKFSASEKFDKLKNSSNKRRIKYYISKIEKFVDPCNISADSPLSYHTDNKNPTKPAATMTEIEPDHRPSSPLNPLKTKYYSAKKLPNLSYEKHEENNLWTKEEIKNLDLIISQLSLQFPMIWTIAATRIKTHTAEECRNLFERLKTQVSCIYSQLSNKQ